MGMTIDEAIDFLEESKYSYESPSSDTLDIAISIMRKYQKIQKIVKAWNDMNSFDSMVKISEVLEDGKID